VALRVKTAAQMHAVLTPAQITQIAQLQAARLAQERATILNNLQQQTQAIESSVK
jgi:hypothetical protein